LCLGLSIVFGRTQVRAEDADELVKRGIELRRKSKDTDALAEFKKAWAISKAPRIEAQMALAEQALGLWVAAEEHLLEALTHAKSDPWTRKNSTTLTSALTVIQRHLGTLDVWGTPAGAAIFVNEKRIGTLPLEHPVRVSDDSVILRVHADDFLEWTRTVRVDPGQSIRQHVELIPGASAAAPTQPPVAASDTGKARGDTSPAGSAVTPPLEAKAVAGIPEASPPPVTAPRADVQPSSSGGLRPYAWAAGAGAVLGIGLGVVETLVANNKHNQFNGLPECGTSNLTGTCRTIQDDHDRAVTLATVGYVSGGGLAVLSAVFFILSSSGDEDPPASVARACVGDVALRGLACVFSF
jgi:hypothetical protein